MNKIPNKLKRLMSNKTRRKLTNKAKRHAWEAKSKKA